jgi:hypothetical protein
LNFNSIKKLILYVNVCSEKDYFQDLCNVLVKISPKTEIFFKFIARFTNHKDFPSEILEIFRHNVVSLKLDVHPQYPVVKRRQNSENKVVSFFKLLFPKPKKQHKRIKINDIYENVLALDNLRHFVLIVMTLNHVSSSL